MDINNKLTGLVRPVLVGGVGSVLNRQVDWVGVFKRFDGFVGDLGVGVGFRLGGVVGVGSVGGSGGSSGSGSGSVGPFVVVARPSDFLSMSSGWNCNPAGSEDSYWRHIDDVVVQPAVPDVGNSINCISAIDSGFITFAVGHGIPSDYVISAVAVWVYAVGSEDCVLSVSVDGTSDYDLISVGSSVGWFATAIGQEFGAGSIPTPSELCLRFDFSGPGDVEVFAAYVVVTYDAP